MPKVTRDTVAVITGASSGIGRATAHAFARRGAAVVLAARRADALHEAVRECERLGGRAVAVPTDVSDERAVLDLAGHALRAFGRLDVWVNNAGVYMLGRVEDTPADAVRRLFEVNLLGYVHGAKAALGAFRRRGAGVLVNVSSVAGKVGMAYAGIYCASKFAVNGLSEALRQEVLDAPGISVCTVMPGGTDTPIFRSGANYSGRAVALPQPDATADEVAGVIVGCVETPQREVAVRTSNALAVAQKGLAPGLGERAAARRGEKNFEAGAAPPSDGNLYQPDPHPAVSGGAGGSGEGGLPVAAAGLAAVGLGVWLAARSQPAGGRQSSAPAGRPRPAPAGIG